MPKRRSARTRNKKHNPRQPLLIVIAGGSGSGKTWLADKLIRALPRLVVRLSLDSFYLDRSHLSPARRARLNFDHPRALDWRRVEQVLHALLSGRRAPVPVYDFKTHSRAARVILVTPRPIILLEGLWPLTRQSIRRLARLSVFLRCPARLRLGRRILRDQASRGRTRSSIHQQFRESVEPMHSRFVDPQEGRADLVFRKNCGTREVRFLAERIRSLLGANRARPIVALEHPN